MRRISFLPSKTPFTFNRSFWRFFFSVGLLVLAAALPLCARAAVKGVYVGNEFYAPTPTWQSNAKNSGFTTLFLFTLHVSANGTIFYNDTMVVSNGVYVGDPTWGAKLTACKAAPSSVNRIEATIGCWGASDFDHIKDLIASQGAGPTSILYSNFWAFKNATGVDAIQYDDESTYDVPSWVTFGNMIASLGMKVTFCPYTRQSVWVNAKSQLGSKVDAIYLQCYDGGAGNDPANWINAFGGFKVYPGLWGNTDTPGSATAKMRNWQQKLGITGGFMWLNGGLPGDAPTWSRALSYGLEPNNGFLAQDTAAYYTASGFTGNQGMGLGPWVLSTVGGGCYISGDTSPLFGLWNSTANGQSTATRDFNAVLLPGDSFSIQLQMGSLNSSSDRNGIRLQDPNGNVLFSYWHEGGDSANGHYSDAWVTNIATGFAYDFNKLDSFTFKLNTATNYTFIDNTTGAYLSGSLTPGALIGKITVFRTNGPIKPPNGQDFKFNNLTISAPWDHPALSPLKSGAWGVQFVAGRGFFSYDVQRATNLAGPWVSIGKVSQPQNGLGSLSDTNTPANQCFYRTVTQ